MSLFKFKNPFKHIFSSSRNENYQKKDEENKIDQPNDSQSSIEEPELKTKEIEVKKIKIIKWEDTIPFTIQIEEGQVIKVYDGDSITIAGHYPMYNSPLFRFSVRLNGIDTPEIKGKTEEEIKMAKEVRDALTNLILHKVVKLKNIGSEKYGRILADVYLDELWVNEWLIKERYAVKYDGGTKKTPKSWLKYKQTGDLK
jgi:endonuclease YncB( thermonuclease family)